MGKGRAGKVPFKFAFPHCRQIPTTGDSHLLLAVQYRWRGCAASCPEFRPPTFLSTNVLLSWHLRSTCQGHEIHKEALRLRFEMLVITGRASRPFLRSRTISETVWIQTRRFPQTAGRIPSHCLWYNSFEANVTTWILPRACNIHITELLLPAACVHGSKGMGQRPTFWPPVFKLIVRRENITFNLLQLSFDSLALYYNYYLLSSIYEA